MENSMQNKLPFENGLHELLSEHVIEMKTIEIVAVYEHLRSFGHCSRDVVRPKGILRLPGSISHGQISMTGVDLPYWLGEFKMDNSNNRIMVIGIDPLRNEMTFNNYNASSADELIIGTPYAMHDPEMMLKKTRVYSNFITHLAQTNFVYLTDIYKYYFEIEGKRSSSCLKRETMWDDFLCNEIRLINPSHVVAFGKEVAERMADLHAQFQNGNESITIIELPHPAARAKTWAKVLDQGKRATNDNKVCHMTTEVYNSLNSVT